MKISWSNNTKLPTSLLIAVNAFLMMLFLMHDIQNALQTLFILPILITLLVISSIYHLILWLFLRRRELKFAIRLPLYLLPVIMLMFLEIILPDIASLPNQKPSLVSHDKKYIMKMDMLHNRWIVSIYDTDGKKLYSDNNSDFHGLFNVYWIWDNNNRLWLYNSDDSFVYYWIKSPNGWKKICWSTESDKKVHKFYPPKALYPKYD